MKCFECDNMEDCTMASEGIYCPHCDESITSDLNMCKECGLFWKSVNDNIVDKTIFRLPPELLSTDSLIDIASDMGIRPASFEIDAGDGTSRSIKSMSDFIHKCIKCNGVCYEEREGLYKCVDCGFELEVVDG